MEKDSVVEDIHLKFQFMYIVPLLISKSLFLEIGVIICTELIIIPNSLSMKYLTTNYL